MLSSELVCILQYVERRSYIYNLFGLRQKLCVHLYSSLSINLRQRDLWLQLDDQWLWMHRMKWDTSDSIKVYMLLSLEPIPNRTNQITQSHISRQGATLHVHNSTRHNLTQNNSTRWHDKTRYGTQLDTLQFYTDHIWPYGWSFYRAANGMDVDKT